MAVNYASSREGADNVVDAITKAGGTAVAVLGDLANAADMQRIFAETTHEAVTHFGEANGSIINIGSVVTSIIQPGGVIYTATKGAVDSITLTPRRSWLEEDPRQLSQSRHGGHGGHAYGWLHRLGAREMGCRSDTAWPSRAGRRHHTHRGVPGLRRFSLADRRDTFSLRRSPVSNRLTTFRRPMARTFRVPPHQVVADRRSVDPDGGSCGSSPLIIAAAKLGMPLNGSPACLDWRIFYGASMRICLPGCTPKSCGCSPFPDRIRKLKMRYSFGFGGRHAGIPNGGTPARQRAVTLRLL